MLQVYVRVNISNFALKTNFLIKLYAIDLFSHTVISGGHCSELLLEGPARFPKGGIKRGLMVAD